MNEKKQLIKNVIKTAYKSKEGHIPSSLSVLDIMFEIYKIIKLNPKDKFILSKGHAALGLYCILDWYKLLEDDLSTFCEFNSKLGGHPTIDIKNIELSTGSLGHGLPIAVGISLAQKIQNKDGKIYVLIGDGESNEGTIWESALLAQQYKLNNLYCILDHNHSNDRALNLNNIDEKFSSFGWNCLKINGHDESEIFNALQIESKLPTFILCETIKGKGCKRMENNPEWHHKIPNEQEVLEIISEIECENSL